MLQKFPKRKRKFFYSRTRVHLLNSFRAKVARFVCWFVPHREAGERFFDFFRWLTLVSCVLFWELLARIFPCFPSLSLACTRKTEKTYFPTFRCRVTSCENLIMLLFDVYVTPVSGSNLGATPFWTSSSPCFPPSPPPFLPLCTPSWSHTCRKRWGKFSNLALQKKKLWNGFALAYWSQRVYRLLRDTNRHLLGVCRTGFDKSGGKNGVQFQFPYR